ncbi:hypothetical protein E2C01_098989 [Portunus trituberculatus]|uniref:Uncharacterized protein n=1 Tax=Portunus trituberculatus TaxID=210409 RepID=A0A5B7K947_PORTR|nr:hypothetical protein [Portunus trituberculatus]
MLKGAGGSHDRRGRSVPGVEVLERLGEGWAAFVFRHHASQVILVGSSLRHAGLDRSPATLLLQSPEGMTDTVQVVEVVVWLYYAHTHTHTHTHTHLLNLSCVSSSNDLSNNDILCRLYIVAASCINRVMLWMYQAKRGRQE